MGSELEIAEPDEILLDDGNRYQELGGSLSYWSNTVKPDISSAIGIPSMYMEQPLEAHWNTALHMLRYLRASLFMASQNHG